MHIKEILLSLIAKASSSKFKNFLDELENSQFLLTEEMNSRQWDKLKELLEFVYRKSEFYKAKFKKCGLTLQELKSKEDFRRLPLTTKEDIQRYNSYFQLEKKRYFIQSSGSSGGIPIRTYLDLESASKKYAVYLRHIFRFGWDFDTKIIYFLPEIYKNKIVDYQNGFSQFFYSFLQNKVAHEFFTNREFFFYDNANVSIERKKLETYCKRINNYKKKLIVARADFLNNLIFKLREANLQISNCSGIVNIGVLLLPAIKKRMAAFFDCRVYNIYGCSELSYVAGSCNKDTDLHINEETHYVEIEKESKNYIKDNGMGSIVVTDLLNRSMPLIRYETNDLGSIVNANCDYPGLRRLKVNGRSCNSIKLNGERLLTEDDLCNTVFNEENVVQFHARFSTNNGLELRIVKAGSINEGLLLERLHCLGLDKLEIKYEDKITENYKDKFLYISKY